MVFYLISICHALVCVFALLLIRKSIKRRGLSVLTLGALVFILVSTLGLTFSHYVDYGAALSFGDDDGMVVYKKIDSVYLSQVISHWIFLAAICISLNWAKKRVVVFSGSRPTKIPGKLAFLILLLIAIFAYVRYFLLGPGLETLLDTNLAYLSAEDAVMARTLAKDNFYGQGVYMASVAANIILPVLFACLMMKGAEGGLLRKKAPYIGALLIFFLLSLAYAFQTRQKAPMIQVVLVYGLLHWCRVRERQRVEQVAGRWMIKAVYGAVAVFILAIASYVVIFNMSIGESVYATVVRIFMVPSATEANYFYVFPKIFEFRGFLESFVIRIFYPPGETGISIYDVAIAATGIQFTANASFLAVGWSGLGYLGVATVSIAMCVSFIYTDSIASRSNEMAKNIVMALSFVPLLTTNSGSLLEYIGAGGVVSPLLFLIASSKAREKASQKF